MNSAEFVDYFHELMETDLFIIVFRPTEHYKDFRLIVKGTNQHCYRGERNESLYWLNDYRTYDHSTSKVISFNEMFDGLPSDIKEKFIYHLDLFI